MDILAGTLQLYRRFQAPLPRDRNVHTRLQYNARRQFPGDTVVSSVLSRFVPGFPTDKGPSPTESPTSTKTTNNPDTPPPQTQTRTQATGVITTDSLTTPPLAQSDQSSSATDTEDTGTDSSGGITKDHAPNESSASKSLSPQAITTQTSPVGLGSVPPITETVASVSMTTTIINQTSTTTGANGRNIGPGIIAGSVVGAVVLLLVLMCTAVYFRRYLRSRWRRQEASHEVVSPLRVGTPSHAQDRSVDKLQAERMRDRTEEDDHDGHNHTTRRDSTVIASDSEMLEIPSPPPSYMA